MASGTVRVVVTSQPPQGVVITRPRAGADGGGDVAQPEKDAAAVAGLSLAPEVVGTAATPPMSEPASAREQGVGTKRPSTRRRKSASAATPSTASQVDATSPAPARGVLHAMRAGWEDQVTVFKGGVFDRATRILPYLWVGDRHDAGDRAWLAQCGITHIVNSAAQLTTLYPDDFHYCHVQVLDMEAQDLSPYFDVCNAFIDEAAAAGTGVLVHCVAGVSRSATIAIAYLVARRRMRLRQAMSHVLARRPTVRPNNGFLYQLAMLELHVFGNSSVATTKDRLWNFFEWNSRRRSVPVAPVDRGCTVC